MILDNFQIITDQKWTQHKIHNQMILLHPLDPDQLTIIENVHGNNEISGILNENEGLDEYFIDNGIDHTLGQIPNRIYAKELLEDPYIEEIERFEVEKLKQNQREHVVYGIIIRHITGIDVTDEYKTLTKGMRKDIEDGLYTLNDTDNLLYYHGKINKPRICLPPEHAKALILYR